MILIINHLYVYSLTKQLVTFHKSNVSTNEQVQKFKLIFPQKHTNFPYNFSR